MGSRLDKKLRGSTQKEAEPFSFSFSFSGTQDFDIARNKALACGAEQYILADLRREFVEELIYPAVQANCIYEVRTPSFPFLVHSPTFLS